MRALVSAALVTSLVLGACTDSTVRESPAFESPQQAADAFAPDELPEVEPWDDQDGRCRALVVGDSLVEATVRAQIDAFSFVGCESIVDGLAARSISEGWQCLADGGRSMAIVVREYPEAGNPSCRPSGLELLRQWSDFTRAASVTVIALGTNDAGMYSEAEWLRRWERVVSLTSGPLVFVTVGARPNDRWVDNADRYNDVLRWWCPSEPRCVLAEWDLTGPASDPASYVDHVHLTRAAGEMRAIFVAVIARRAAVPAPPGPRRWRAPEIVFPVAPTSSSTGSPGPVNSSPVVTIVPVPTTTAVVIPPTFVVSTTTTNTTSTTTSTTTTNPPAGPGDP